MFCRHFFIYRLPLEAEGREGGEGRRERREREGREGEGKGREKG